MTKTKTKTQKSAVLASLVAVALAGIGGCANQAASPVTPSAHAAVSAGAPGSAGSPDSAGSASLAGSAIDQDLTARIVHMIDASEADVGVFAQSLDTGETVEIGADESYPMLSTFKVYAVAAFLDRFGTGAALDDTVTIAEPDLVDNSPVTSENVGRRMSYRDLAIAALTRSDNTAGNLLLRKIGGPAAIGDFASRVGDSASRLDRWEVELNEATPGDERDSTTARGLAAGYRAVLDGDVLTPEARELLVGWMGDTETSDKLSRAELPEGWTTADESGGGYYGTRNTAGLVLGPEGQRILLVVLSRDGKDRRDAPYAEQLISDIAAETTDLGA